MTKIYIVAKITNINGKELMQTIIGAFKEKETAKNFAEEMSNMWNHYSVKEINTDLF